MIAATTDNRTDLDATLVANIRILNSLIRLQEDQDRAERLAFDKGVQFALGVLDKYAPEIFEAGRADMEREVNAAWAEVAARSHFLGSPLSRTYAEKRAEELESLKPRPNDFPGLDNDPHCLDHLRATASGA
jgi:hypothetical protein